jgi:hypothetical protein
MATIEQIIVYKEESASNDSTPRDKLAPSADF